MFKTEYTGRINITEFLSLKLHIIFRQIIDRVLNFIDLDIKIFTDFISIFTKIVFLSFIYVPLLTLGILAVEGFANHFILIVSFLIFGLFCKVCTICGVGFFIGVSAIGLIIACIFKITWLGVITGVILLIRIEANDLLKEYDY